MSYLHAILVFFFLQTSALAGPDPFEVTEPLLSPVEICYAPTNYREFAALVGTGIDRAATGLGLEHAWIRTPNKEMGMGLGRPFPISTEWQDHSGFGEREVSRCYALPQCDQACVEDEMREGESTGLYGAVNTCQHLAKRTLTRCGCRDVCISYRRNGRCRDWALPPLLVQ